MTAEVTLTVTEGPYKGRHYSFSEPTVCTIGRGSQCGLQLPNDFLSRTISRQHCRLGIDPPFAWLQDLGSRNGTFVNGHNIGQAEPWRGPDDKAAEGPEWNLEDGDEIRVGNTVFRVAILATPGEMEWNETPADATPVLAN